MMYARVVLSFSIVLLAGCAGQQALIDEQRSAIDELAIENTRLERQIAVLQDSLQFIDDVESGQYFRDRRVLEDRINRLEYDLAVCRDDSEFATTEIATFGADELFAPASANLTEEGTARLEGLVPDLRGHAGGRIRIEGHSDSVPLGPGLLERYPSNWELSAARASAVVRALIENFGLDPEQLEVAAFGDSRPVASNQTAAGRSQNRRVRIAIY